MSRTPYEKALARSRRQAISLFHRAARTVPAYKMTLKEHAINPSAIRTWDDFQRLPVLTKADTFQRYPLEALCVGGTFKSLASVLTSSGQSGSFAFGLTTRGQERRSQWMIDLGLEATFEVGRHQTLVVNALPMGVGFTSQAVTVAETSVREDMVLALVKAFGPHFQQVILVTDPLFLKLLCDVSRDQKFDWSRLRVNAIVGEETFGEHFRSYVCSILGTDPDNLSGPLVGASMGAGELGLNLFFETPQTIALRRRLCRDPSFRQHFFAETIAAERVPMLFAYSPASLCVECLDDGRAPPGYGQLTMTKLFSGEALPLIRYQTGDLARLYAPQDLRRLTAPLGLEAFAQWRLPVMALRGRDSEETGGPNVSEVKDCLYRDAAVAHRHTGAFRIEGKGAALNMHLQLRPTEVVSDELAAAVCAQLPLPLSQPGAVKLWAYEAFPYGMRLDYERKFKCR